MKIIIQSLILFNLLQVAYGESLEIKFFQDTVRPILKEKCYNCHSHESGKSKGGLVLDSISSILKGGTSGPAVVPFKPKKSLLIQSIKRIDEDTAMPPKTSLTLKEIEVFQKWIQEGATGPKSELLNENSLELKAKELWSFKPIRKFDQSNKINITEAIDRFIDVKLKDQGLKPVKRASPDKLIRRVYLDLTGILPSPETVESFVINPSKNKYEEIVENLLNSPQFGERWGRHWLDTARFAESNGGDNRHLFQQAWKYRNWVFDAYNTDMPYNNFLTQQIAGDLLPFENKKQKARQITATGFLTVGSKPLAAKRKEEQEKSLEMLLDPIDAVSIGTMGLTVGCAKCHDHKFDPISIDDYYAMAGIFKSTRLWFGPPWGNLKSFLQVGGFEAFNHLYDPNLYTLDQSRLTQAKNIQKQYWRLLKVQQKDTRSLRRLKKKISKPKKKLSSKEIQQIKLEIPKAEKLAQVSQQKLDIFLKKHQQFSVEQIMAATEGDPQNVSLRYGGEFKKNGPIVPRGYLSHLTFNGSNISIDKDESGRLALAKWITHVNNPLTPRVAVNRIWSQLFGQGIVETVDNFGFAGTPPSHPELLDFLAYQFIHKLNWSSKKLIQKIVLSNAYTRTAVHSSNESQISKDPLNVYLWRMVPRRLEVEIIRDNILATAGFLDLERPKRSIVENFKQNMFGTINDDLLKKSSELFYHNIRSVYLPLLRGKHYNMYDLFDYPEDEAVNSLRSSSTFATQGIFLLNNKLLSNSAELFAKRLNNKPSLKSDEDKIKYAYLVAYSRPPKSIELREDLQFLENMKNSNAWALFCQSLIISSEFLYRF
ncbi:MAG: PSD1 and planctomycete cytochrome C domain-containing protein [Lentisphaeraceae bacterium]|nr:PSD1 and planctomycete cytochrome C domain-containing protein [Lentisphaeraceae bacterium]